MASSAQLRLMSDLKSIANEPPEGCSASPLSEDNLFVWSATIFGPDETPWEGGVFTLRLIFGDNYPEKPPRVRFTSEIFHPNGVGLEGRSVVDELLVVYLGEVVQTMMRKKEKVPLQPSYRLECGRGLQVTKAVTLSPLSLQSLLTDPNPASPANPEAARMYQHDIQDYNRRVRRCARKSVES
ncbi:hypothetical protein Syun_004460 [Stephania yunnanensis]|uniref:UBC core domain-containing protein n=1 Tax=Stephania yunnanensis TaxID=152371 RepID=A0AAP0L347_9MAGN